MTILSVDDHTLFSTSLSIALSDFPEITRFSSTKDLEHLRTALGDEPPDILLIDINLGKLTEADGLFLAKGILEAFPTQKVVILSGYDLPAYRKEAKNIGAKGFINKEIEPEELVQILLTVQSGGIYFKEEALFLEDLTPAEKQVLELLAKGVKRKDIARRLFLSERTVSNHLQHVFEKLRVSSALGAVTEAIRLGYLPPLH